jgi:3-methyl-2-oxobutanoate hydroxymethyltransferase
MKSIHELTDAKTRNESVTLVTCYDFTTAKILNACKIDALLVGDSVAMVMHGHESTIHATPEMMALHTAAVKKGAPDKLLIADMPFLSFRKGRNFALEVVEQLVRAGAHAVKLEGVLGHEDVIRAIVESGVPVMGHLGLTPQSILGLGGYKVQGRTSKAAQAILDQAQILSDLGCFSLVLECVPAALASEIRESLEISVIGIGAGPDVDGQVLVLHDLLGLSGPFKPKFLRHFASGELWLKAAVDDFHHAVTAGEFPNEEESYQ